MSSSAIKIDDIVVSSETRMVEVALDSYENAASRNFVEQYAQRVTSDGSEVKFRIREMSANFKTSKNTDDRSNYPKIDQAVIKTITFDYSHVGAKVSGRQWRDSDGEVQEILNEWGAAVGDSAGVHTMVKALEAFQANAASVITGSAIFGSHTLLSGQTYDNRIQVDLTGTDETTLVGVGTALTKMRSTVKTKAGFARSFSDFVILCGSKMHAKLSRATKATQINGTDVTSYLGHNVKLFEVQEMENDYGYWNGDEDVLIIGIPVSGFGGIIQADREGLELSVFGPEDSYVLNRRDIFDYLADFRRSTLMGAPECLLKVQHDALA